MAIGTATAIGLGISALSSGMSFAQAGKQRKLQEEAEKEAQKACHRCQRIAGWHR